MLKKTIGAAAIVAMSAVGAQAQEETYTADGFGPEAGDWELILGASGNNDEDFENGGFNLNAEIGYYLTEDLEGGVRQFVGYNDVGGEQTDNYSTAAFLDYHFDFNAIRPFVGASLGYIYGDGVNDTFAAGPEAGLKWYVKDETFIYGRAAYLFNFEDTDDADEAFDDGRFEYVVGIGFNF